MAVVINFNLQLDVDRRALMYSIHIHGIDCGAVCMLSQPLQSIICHWRVADIVYRIVSLMDIGYEYIVEFTQIDTPSRIIRLLLPTRYAVIFVIYYGTNRMRRDITRKKYNKENRSAKEMCAIQHSTHGKRNVAPTAYAVSTVGVYLRCVGFLGQHNSPTSSTSRYVVASLFLIDR